MTADIKTVLTDEQRNNIWLDLTDSGTISKATFNKAVDAIERAVLSAIDSERAAAPASSAIAMQASGYKLVPVEPTNDMWDAGLDAQIKSDVREIYRAMVEAAPQLAQPSAEAMPLGWRISRIEDGKIVGEVLHPTKEDADAERMEYRWPNEYKAIAVHATPTTVDQLQDVVEGAKP
jgi:hypothetical protein